jgi:hypothetical protein
MSIPTKRLSLTECLVIGIALVAICAIAYPKWAARNNPQYALSQQTGKALSSALNAAHAKWEAAGGSNKEFLDLTGEGVGDMAFNDLGWPTGISADGKSTLSAISNKGAIGHDACGQIFHKLIDQKDYSVIAADNQGVCHNGDICAKALSDHECQFQIRKTNEFIYYNAQTGQVNVQKTENKQSSIN